MILGTPWVVTNGDEFCGAYVGNYTEQMLNMTNSEVLTNPTFCLSDGDGLYGDNEDCTITVLRDIVVNAPYFAIDHLCALLCYCRTLDAPAPHLRHPIPPSAHTDSIAVACLMCVVVVPHVARGAQTPTITLIFPDRTASPSCASTASTQAGINTDR